MGYLFISLSPSLSSPIYPTISHSIYLSTYLSCDYFIDVWISLNFSSDSDADSPLDITWYIKKKKVADSPWMEENPCMNDFGRSPKDSNVEAGLRLSDVPYFIPDSLIRISLSMPDAVETYCFWEAGVNMTAPRGGTVTMVRVTGTCPQQAACKPECIHNSQTPFSSQSVQFSSVAQS